MSHLGVELRNETLEPLDTVEHLDTLGVRIESDLEWSAHGAHPTSEFVFSIFEALGDVVNRLIVLILIRLYSCRRWIESAMLALVAQRVNEFTIRGQQSGAVCFDLLTFLAEAKFNGEPIDGRQLFDFRVGRAERGQTDFLRKLGEAGIGKKWHVS